MSAKSYLDGGMAAQGSRSAMPAKWGHRHWHFFGSVVEASSYAKMKGTQRLTSIVAVNKAVGEGQQRVLG